MSKSTGSTGNNGEGTTTIVKMNALGAVEKGKIEKLVEKRASNVKEYLNELGTALRDANNHVPFSKQSVIDQIAVKQQKLNLEETTIKTSENSELVKVDSLLKVRRDRRLARLEKLVKKVSVEYAEAFEAAKSEIEKAYIIKKNEFIDRRSEMKVELARLEVEKSMEQAIRDVALESSLNKLRTEVRDIENRATEKVWSDCVLPSDAKDILNSIPDGREFREMISPEMMFEAFNKTIITLALPQMVKCTCGSTDLKRQTFGNGIFICTTCGKSVVVRDNMRLVMALPSITDMIGAKGLPAPQPA